ncbi:MAG: metallophosphoesterase [Culicoidibacterales bacterium]
MSVIYLGDLHFGAKKDCKYIQNVQLEAVTHLCNHAKKNGIRVLVQTGDWFDVRAGLSQETMRFQREVILPLLRDAFDTIHVIVGNHDMHLKNQIRPNSVYESFHSDSLFNVIEEPTTVSIGGDLVDLIPWECSENKEQIRNFIHKSSSEICVGHWELTGFEFYKGVPSTGEETEFLEKYVKVISGHYHTQSQKGNIQYIGTPYTLTLGDANDVRGFWVKDGESFELIQNPNCWHHKIHYNEKFDTSTIKGYTGKVVQIIVEKTDERLESTLTMLETVCHELTQKYIEEFQFESSEDIKPQNLLSIVNEFVQALDVTDDEKTMIVGMMRNLHAEASE